MQCGRVAAPARGRQPWHPLSRARRLRAVTRAIVLGVAWIVELLSALVVLGLQAGTLSQPTLYKLPQAAAAGSGCSARILPARSRPGGASFE